MKDLSGVTDNDWFAFLSQQAGIDEVNFLPKTARQSAIKTADKKDGVQALQKDGG